MERAHDGRRESILVPSGSDLDNLIESANALAALLEAAAPAAGLKHERHARSIMPARRKVERVMRSYFNRQMHALLAEIKPKITAREASQGGNQYAHSILPSSIHPLRFPVTQAETSEYNDAIEAAIRGAAASIAAGEIVVDDVVSRYLRDNSLTRLTGEISDTSVNRLRDAIADAWDAGGSFNQVVSAIQATFSAFSDVRAGMIAQTEVNDAYNRGRMATAIMAGFDQKAWDPDGDACPICLDNVDAGWIGIDEDFPSGDPAPTAHPNCDCSIDFQKGFEE
jgi:hypothetical protein